MHPGVQWRRKATVVVVLGLVILLVYLLSYPLSHYDFWDSLVVAIFVLLGFGSVILVPLWRGYSALADYEVYVDEDEDPLDLTDLVGIIVDDAHEFSKKRKR